MRSPCEYIDNIEHKIKIIDTIDWPLVFHHGHIGIYLLRQAFHEYLSANNTIIMYDESDPGLNCKIILVYIIELYS